MNIGFYLLNIEAGNGYQASILNSINELCKIRPYDQIVLFNDITQVIHSNTGYYMLHINEAKYFDGILFVFDAKSLMLSKDFPSPVKQIFIMAQAEWAQNKTTPYRAWESLFMPNNIELVTTNTDLENLCSICWKDPVANIDQLNGEILNNVLQKI